MHEAIAEADLRVALALHEGFLASGAVLHPLHRRAVLAEQDVPAGDVVREPVDRLGAAQTADFGRRLEEVHVAERKSTFHEKARKR